MKLRIPLVLALVLTLSLAADLLANCRNEGPYPIQQCQSGTYFAPPPAGSGSVSAAWWQLGFGNRSIVDPTNGFSNNASDGDGFIDTPLPGIFIGNDSGSLTIGPIDGTPTGGMDLISAGMIGGPAGSLCFAEGANWALPFLDGCPDNNVLVWLGGGYDRSDDILNPYWSWLVDGPGTYATHAQLDRPMGFLLTEGTETYFALAFVATESRGKNESDVSPGGFDLGSLVNGDPNPFSGEPNVIPWQPVPQPNYSVSFADPSDSNSERLVAMSWTPIRLVHDGSIRPNILTTWIDEDFLRDLLGSMVVGAGVLDQPELARYQVQSRGVDDLDACGSLDNWVDLGTPTIHPERTSTVLVPPDTCIRLCTILGSIPEATLRETPSVGALGFNRFNAQAAMLGDIGYQVCSRPRLIGGPLLTETTVLRGAVLKGRNTLVVEFETLSESNVTRFDIMAHDRRGDERKLAEVDCLECSTGVGAKYSLEQILPSHRGIKSVFVLTWPSQYRSNEIRITRGR